MSENTEILLSLRPVIETEPAINPSEKFQNETLRPILKFQNDTLIRVVRQYAFNRKTKLSQLTEADKKLYITNVLRQDIKLHSLLKGIVIGHFTEEEWLIYIAHEADVNRRISNLILQRLLSNLAEL
ncbi:hypothetical protein SAMN04487995_2976 [Dyadobacter koreensis]|uniref:Glyoxalase n=1 Tax=Dyadobacter koreensis TaxID=408657 RepID=A0A1H6V6P5_9BACT|nr:hypothetical protein [Dyadobacter koreensis]SEJ00263.1 hypothetical protein SAMN04487995_2976 [Dyadobacter koreensis]